MDVAINMGTSGSGAATITMHGSCGDRVNPAHPGKVLAVVAVHD